MSVFLYEPLYDIERLFEQALYPSDTQRSGYQVQRPRGSENAVRASLKPRMDLHENNESNVVTATFEFPGVSKENVQIDVQNGKLTVSAETTQSSKHDEHGYAIRERRYGKYSRTLQLPQGVKDEEIEAAMDNGVLTVKFPKSAPEAVPKRIAIV